MLQWMCQLRHSTVGLFGTPCELKPRRTELSVIPVGPRLFGSARHLRHLPKPWVPKLEALKLGVEACSLAR